MKAHRIQCNMNLHIREQHMYLIMDSSVDHFKASTAQILGLFLLLISNSSIKSCRFWLLAFENVRTWCQVKGYFHVWSNLLLDIPGIQIRQWTLTLRFFVTWCKHQFNEWFSYLCFHAWRNLLEHSVHSVTWAYHHTHPVCLLTLPILHNYTIGWTYNIS